MRCLFSLLVVVFALFTAGCTRPTDEENARRAAEANRDKAKADRERFEEEQKKAKLEGTVAPANWQEIVDQKVAAAKAEIRAEEVARATEEKKRSDELSKRLDDSTKGWKEGLEKLVNETAVLLKKFEEEKELAKKKEEKEREEWGGVKEPAKVLRLQLGSIAAKLHSEIGELKRQLEAWRNSHKGREKVNMEFHKVEMRLLKEIESREARKKEALETIAALDPKIGN